MVMANSTTAAFGNVDFLHKGFYSIIGILAS